MKVKLPGLLGSWFLICTVVTAQSAALTVLPFEFSGQHGLASDDGRLLYDRDWHSGIQIIPGGMIANPLRLGGEGIMPVEIGPLFDTVGVFIDSARVRSRLKYRRGDYNFDQLLARVDFTDRNRHLTVSGFKRTYAGMYGELANLDNIPLQQSYRCDYRFADDDGRGTVVSVGKYLSNDGFYLPGAGFGVKNESLTASLLSTAARGPWQFTGHGGLMLNERSRHYQAGDSLVAEKANFRYWRNLARYRAGNGDTLTIGLRIEDHSTARASHRGILFSAGINKGNFSGMLGGQVAGPRLRPYWDLQYHRPAGRLLMKFKLQGMTVAPRFTQGRQDDDRWEDHYRLAAGLGWRQPSLDVQISSNFEIRRDFHQFRLEADSLVINPVNAELWTNVIQMRWSPWDSWNFALHYRHLEYSHVSMTDGIGDRLDMVINGGLPILFKGALDLRLMLAAGFWLNRDRHFHWDPARCLPLYRATPFNYRNAFPITFRLEAHVSTVIISYQIDNLAVKLAPLLAQINSNWDRSYFTIDGNSDLYPLPALVSFGVDWQFSQ